MPHYAFIDESGTLEEHKVMTVALVVLDGHRAAEKIHLRLSKSLFNPPKARGLAEKQKWYQQQKLHFTDMNDVQKVALGTELGKANSEAIIAHYWHTEESNSHQHRFWIYTRLLKATINKAFESFDDLVVSIGKQGGWQSYSKNLLQEMRQLPESFTRDGHFRKGEFFLSSAAKPGQQIADFYASSSRSFLLSDPENNYEPYRLIQHHVKHFEQLRLTTDLIKEK